MTRHSILVVDDSPTDRHFLSELLLSQGYQVTAVENGEAALASIKSNPPHLVIMDVVMPGQNGFQATREITRDPATRSLYKPHQQGKPVVDLLSWPKKCSA